MKLFIGNLPGSATLAELDELLGGIKLHADVQVCKGRDKKACDYHYFIARTANDETGQQLINHFNGKLFHGRPIVVRQFIERKCDESWEGPERRINQV
jgi:hypothetical protein